MIVADNVNKMFASIAKRYDVANHVLSFGMDYYWRRELVRAVKVYRPGRVVDLATGSGDVAFALKKALGEGVAVKGLDFCEGMLEEAERKKRAKGVEVEFGLGDCLDLPLEDGSVDVLTIAFGLRNLGDRARGLREMYRVLKKPGGVLLVLEFSQPEAWMRGMYYFYLKRVLPTMAKLTTGNRDAYDYLGKTIGDFPGKEELSEEMRMAGFGRVEAKGMTGGTVALHEGLV